MKIRAGVILLTGILLCGCAMENQEKKVKEDNVKKIYGEAVETLENGEGYSREGLKKTILQKNSGTYSKKEVSIAVEVLEERKNIDWESAAYDAAENYIASGQGFSKKGLFWTMTAKSGNLFSEKEAKYAIDRLEYEGKLNWDREALKATENIAENNPDVSELGLKKELVSEKGYGFTTHQAHRAVQKFKEANS